MRITQLLVSGLLATAVPVPFAAANADGERAALARIDHEFQSIEPLITEASSQDWLRQDVDRIRRGVQAHIDAPRSEPRTFPPLRGDYRR